jgi:hypothetical protein
MAHGFLSYQDNRGEVDYLGKIYRAIKDFLDEKEKREKRKQAVDEAIQEVQVREEQETQAALPGAETPLLTGGNQKALPESPPARKMLAGSALERSLPGSVAVNPTVVGGASNPYTQPTRRLDSSDFAANKIVDISSGSVTSYDPDDNFMATSVSDVGGGTEEIVQAIDRLTFVTLDLVQATQQQTRNDALVAQQQARQASKIAEKSRVAADKAAFTNDDFSGNLGYTKLAGLLGAGGSGGRGLGGFGMKAGATTLGKMAMKRGGARAATRLGAGVGMKLGGKAGAKLGARMGAKALGGVVGKKLPFGLGLAVAGGFAADRFAKGDVVGGIGEVLSGLAAVVPGVGTAASLGIDGLLAARDFGLTPFNQGGIPLGQNVPALLNDRADGKPEAVMPLTDDTFLKFGEGYLDAMKKNKKDYARLQALGLEEYSNRAQNRGGFNLFDPSTWGGGGGNNETPNYTQFDYQSGGNNGGGNQYSITPGAGAAPVGMDRQKAFAMIYQLAVKHGAKFPEIVAAQAMHETHWLSDTAASVFNASGRTNAFGQTGDRGHGTMTRPGDPSGWTKYSSLEESVADNIKLWHRVSNNSGNYEAFDNPMDGLLSVTGDYSPNEDPANKARGFTEDAYRRSMAEILTSMGFSLDKRNEIRDMSSLAGTLPVTPATTPGSGGLDLDESGDNMSQSEKNYAADTTMDPGDKMWSAMLKGSYGLTPGQSIEFGPNKEFRATKLIRDMGFKFERKVEGIGAMLGGWRPVNTAMGKNLWLKDMFLKAVKDRVRPVPKMSSFREDNAENEQLQLQSAAPAAADSLNTASAEVASAANRPQIVAVVTGEQSQSQQPGGNRPVTVPAGISAADTGTETFSKAKTMLIS